MFSGTEHLKNPTELDKRILIWKEQYNHVEYWATILRLTAKYKTLLLNWKPLLKELKKVALENGFSKEEINDMLFGLEKKKSS